MPEGRCAPRDIEGDDSARSSLAGHESLGPLSLGRRVYSGHETPPTDAYGSRTVRDVLGRQENNDPCRNENV